MHNVASVSGLSIFDFPSIFSDVYILLVLHFWDSIGGFSSSICDTSDTEYILIHQHRTFLSATFN